ncbi:MAG: (d)CMP kinase [Kineosporiaceae bacterium]
MPGSQHAPRRPLVVAVDGPSGSGKSTVSRQVALRLGLEYLDTGAMYRAVCWVCLDRGIDLGYREVVAEVSREIDLEIGTDPDAPFVRVDGRDVGREIRSTEVTAAVSTVAANQAVRDELRRRQQDAIAAARQGPRHGVVAEGRDITTVVAPDADVRILLTASEGARLARRALDVHGSDDEQALAATRDQVVRRDADDARVAQFLEAADGVVRLDSSAMSPEQTVEAVLAIVARHLDGVEVLGKDLLVELPARVVGSPAVAAEGVAERVLAGGMAPASVGAGRGA